MMRGTIKSHPRRHHIHTESERRLWLKQQEGMTVVIDDNIAEVSIFFKDLIDLNAGVEVWKPRDRSYNQVIAKRFGGSSGKSPLQYLNLIDRLLQEYEFYWITSKEIRFEVYYAETRFLRKKSGRQEEQLNLKYSHKLQWKMSSKKIQNN